MTRILQNIRNSVKKGEKLLAVLIDPDKLGREALPQFIAKVEKSTITHIFVGGSTVKEHVTQALVSTLKILTQLPVVLFPGDVTQISKDANALLFLSLISGRNPDYLIGKHLQSVSILKGLDLEVIPTGYILIESGIETAVQRVTNTFPLKEKETIVETAIAGQLLGMQLIYLEAGSGAKNSVKADIITAVKQELKIPLIVGGGITTKQQLDDAYTCGADLVVIGTAFENDASFFNEIKK